ncbi:MAG TPA: 5'-3' exonuclease H3TH domain-containing protein [Polyangiaceae bacterium]|jgi:5'-3' exonuclease|nr:5'-3' exonuclease H3TH domain-containing protein [Polyangiaceae bacterium]
MRLHLVDGTFELFRAHFSKRPSHVVEGRDRKATVGLASAMLALLHEDEERVTHIAIAFDNPIRSVRNEWFPHYKSDEGVAEEILAQFDAAEEAARALGIVVWSMNRYEADDALATAAVRFCDAVEQVRILTPDKDLGQVLDADRIVLVDRVRKQVIDEGEFFRRRGVRPARVPDWLALVGDTADGIPGLDGFGDKTAAVLLQKFGPLEAIPDDPRKWPPTIRRAEALAATLASHRGEVFLYRKLATLIRDVPLRESFEDLAWPGVDRPRFEAWCDRLGASSDLRARPTRWAPSRSSTWSSA